MELSNTPPKKREIVLYTLFDPEFKTSLKFHLDCSPEEDLALKCSAIMMRIVSNHNQSYPDDSLLMPYPQQTLNKFSIIKTNIFFVSFQTHIVNPILDTRISYVLRPSSCSVTLRLPPLYSEMGCTGELWSKTKFLILEN